jgi:hypothetical protein
VNVLNDFDDIKARYRVGNEGFEKGFKFALLLCEGRSKVQAYREAVDSEGNADEANKYSRFKFVQAIVERLVAGNFVLFADKHYKALEELYRLGMESGSDKVRSDSLIAFIDRTGLNTKKVDVEVNINLGTDMLDRIEQQLNSLASSSLLVQKSGDVIECKVIE